MPRSTSRIFSIASLGAPVAMAARNPISAPSSAPSLPVSATIGPQGRNRFIGAVDIAAIGEARAALGAVEGPEPFLGFLPVRRDPRFQGVALAD